MWLYGDPITIGKDCQYGGSLRKKGGHPESLSEIEPRQSLYIEANVPHWCVMIKRFLACRLEQPFLLPHSLQNWVPEYHLARFIADVMNELDLSAI